MAHIHPVILLLGEHNPAEAVEDGRKPMEQQPQAEMVKSC